MALRRKRRRESDEEQTRDTDESSADVASAVEPPNTPLAAANESTAPLGPFDVADPRSGAGAPERIDLGSMLIPLAEEMEIRVEIDTDSQEPMAVTLLVEDGAVQLKTFAAPRSGGLWIRARGELSQQVTSEGGTIEERQGSFGQELLAHVSATDDKDRPFVQTVRFVGVEGPRWMLQGVFLGAGTEPGTAGRLEALFRQVVVVRGEQAAPAGGPLPLRLPEGVAEELGEAEEFEEEE
ncbi:MAG: DUF3710 domain-containing protein [Candidatus Nanopelagicales bacterium]|nr:DUF3710 domain-containing protein [Candidatus Nanopelagicales bacterium]